VSPQQWLGISKAILNRSWTASAFEIDQQPVRGGMGPPAAFQCVGKRLDAIPLLQCDEQTPRAIVALPQ
jgi:hypothetical protein